MGYLYRKPGDPPWSEYQDMQYLDRNNLSRNRSLAATTKLQGRTMTQLPYSAPTQNIGVDFMAMNNGMAMTTPFARTEDIDYTTNPAGVIENDTPRYFSADRVANIDTRLAPKPVVGLIRDLSVGTPEKLVAREMPSNKIAETPLTYKSGRSNRFQSMNDNKEASAGLLARIGLNAGNYFMNKNKINNAANLASTKIYPTMMAETRSVAAVEDMPKEVLMQRQNDIANLKSQYRGSDATLDVLSKSMVETEKAGLREKLGSERAAGLQASEQRAQEQIAGNELSAIRARNLNEASSKSEDARIRDVGVQKEEAMRDLNSKYFVKGEEMLDAASSYALTKDLKEKEVGINSLDRELDMLMYRMGQTDDPVQQQDLTDKYNKKLKEREGFTKSAIPSYWDVVGKSLTFNTGSKLRPRTV